MTKGLIFWLLMILWFIFGMWVAWPLGNGPYYPLGGNVLLFVLLALLGWRTFGSPVKD